MNERPGTPPPIVFTRRAVRLAHTLAAVAVGVVVLVFASLSGGAAGSDDGWTKLSGLEGLAAAPCPEPSSLPEHEPSAEKLAAARGGEFDVFGRDPSTLEIPVEWSEDPLGARRYRQNLHKLRFLAPLLASYASSGDPADLDRALAFAVDWVEANPRAKRSTPVEAWADKVVGDRTPYLAYMLRAGACEDLLGRGETRLLLGSLDKHGRVLAANRNYTADNHGLFVDLGLLRLSNELPILAGAPVWGELARKRFERTLRGRLSQGVWLEHSSAYQFLAVRPVESFVAELGGDAELEGLLARMKAAAAWFIRPDGLITQFGDSNLEPIPDWAAAEYPALEGLQPYFGAGFAFVRASSEGAGAGYLAVTGGFHNLTHSFELYDDGRSIVNDTGLFHKDPGEVRDYVVSSRAHSALTVDGLDFPIADRSLTYGSGLTAAGGGDGWYAIEGRNPLVRGQGVRHRRLFLYAPGRALVIVDEVRSDLDHAYTRYLTLHPNVRIDGNEREVLGLRAEDFAGAVYDVEAGNPADRTQARGEREPLQGLTSPNFRKFRKRWTIAYRHTGSTELRALTIALDPSGLHASAVAADGPVSAVELADAAGAAAGELVVTREGRTLTVDAR